MKTMLKFNPCHRVCPLYRGWPLLGGSVMGSSTVHALMYEHPFPFFYQHSFSERS